MNVERMCVSSIVSLVIVSISVLLVSVFLTTFVQKLEDLQSFPSIGILENVQVENASSVWCQFDETGNRLCTFKNLCYLPRFRQFIFVFSSRSLVSGVSENRLLRLLELSSVQNHNRFSLKLVLVSDAHAEYNYSTRRIKSVMLLHRFKWDNLMHVIHDDLMPLFFTYMSICAGNVEKCISYYNLAFVDEGDSGPYYEWYNLFSHEKPLHLHREGKDTMICFDECRTGVVRDSVWYQYGFGKPQGPVNNSKITREMVKQFSTFIKKKFVGYGAETSLNTTVLISRKINRKILNEPFVLQSVKTAVKNHFPAITMQNVYSVDLSVNSTQVILSLLVKSKLLLGMHGSAMILGLFLEPGSIIIELFPYAINATHVSAMKSICSLVNLGLVYKSWTNMVENNSVPHPEAPPLLGGIVHLQPQQQQLIKSSYPVPAVHCCHEPVYLYRMFQDTIVEESFNEVLHRALVELKSMSVTEVERTEFEKRWENWFFPAEVTGVRCSYDKSERTVQVSWIPPVNIRAGDVVTYKLAIVGGMSQLDRVSSLPQFFFTLPSHFTGDVNLNIWIKSEVNRTESADVHLLCNFYV